MARHENINYFIHKKFEHRSIPPWSRERDDTLSQVSNDIPEKTGIQASRDIGQEPSLKNFGYILDIHS